MRYLGEQEVEDIAMGAAVMASGGGGNPYVGILIAKQCVADNGPIPLLTLDELPDDARVAVSMGLGAPTVLVEKVPAGPEPVYALEALEREVGHTFDALIPSEAGGWNSLHPMLPAAQRRIPLLDADGMGRAFPELQMVTWSMYGQSASPIGVADERGNTLLMHAATNKCGEDLCRGATVEMGGNISLACYGMTGVAPSVVSRVAWGIWRAWMPIRAACSMCVSRTNSLLPSAMGKWCARHPILSPCSIAKRSRLSRVRL